MPTPTTSAAAIVLAAGSSSRMGDGRHKLLLPLGGRPVIAHVVDAVLASQARPIVVVLGHQAEQVRTALVHVHHDILLVENPAYPQGMSSSLHTGIRALQRWMDAADTRIIDSAVILLGDQPLLTPSIIDALIAARQATQQPIVASHYAGQRGNPLLFAANLFPELLEVTGDEGGRSVVARHRAEVAAVEQGDSIVQYDVDTWDAYQQVVAIWQQQHSDNERAANE